MQIESIFLHFPDCFSSFLELIEDILVFSLSSINFETKDEQTKIIFVVDILLFVFRGDFNMEIVAHSSPQSLN